MAVDVMGMVLGVLILPANISNVLGGRQLLRRTPFGMHWTLFLFNGGYDKPAIIHWRQTLWGVGVEIAHRLGSGFQMLPKRWIVERTLG
jgi:hypothetical protein